MTELVFATNNRHKLEEVQQMLPAHIRLKSLEDIGCTADIPETGDTFHENSRQKAAYVTEHFGLDCFGDDSGLEIDALNGEPGVYSARYSGSRDMDRNIELVLQKLRGIENRAARFKTVLCLMLNGQTHYFEGSVEGSIIHFTNGTKGFGYDPIFVPDGYGLTFAQMELAEKNLISHRARALAQLSRFLESLQ